MWNMGVAYLAGLLLYYGLSSVAGLMFNVFLPQSRPYPVSPLKMINFIFEYIYPVVA